MSFTVSLLAAAVLAAAPTAPAKKLLLVTSSTGFIHDSVGEAEDVLKKVGPENGYDVTCYRLTVDPTQKVKYKPKKDSPQEVEATLLEKYSADFRARTGKTVEAEHCGRVNAETLKKFDVVLFFTTGNPTTPAETKDLVEWVKAGGAFAGTHCATDTLYKEAEYGKLVGGYFDGHPWHKKIKLKVEDAKHPAAAGFEDGAEITDEIYQFKNEPYSRESLRILLSVDNSTIDLAAKGVKRTDKDFAVAWVQEFGKGKSFYTSLGHRKEVWNDPRFQKHLFGGLDWTVGRVKGDATPSSKR